MFTDDQKDRDRVVATVLSAQGDIFELPAAEALEQLSRAVLSSTVEDIPYGAVLHEQTASAKSLRVGSTWEQFIIAYRRAESALSHLPSTVFDNVEALTKIELGPDFDIIAASSRGSHYVMNAKRTDRAYELKLRANKDDVFVLFTHFLAADMKPAVSPPLPESTRFIVRVCSLKSAARGHHELTSLQHEYEQVPELDGKTLSWRQQFVDDQGELLPRFRQPPMIASFMREAEPASTQREHIPVPKGPVEVW